MQLSNLASTENAAFAALEKISRKKSVKITAR
jgi:hypothetical protein